MRFSSLSEWLAWLEGCHPKAIDLGLERVAAVAGRMAINLTSTQVITVAGTNGKGSCVAALERLCMTAGVRVGCYTSPHLLRYNERIRVQGEPVADEPILQAFQRVDAALGDDSLTYFEYGTLAALDIFQRSGLDVVVLEVGLGGRLDAVNLVDADIAIVTSVALDHIDWLGDNRESIGFEKAGIFRPGKPAICADADAPQSLVNHAAQLGAKLLQIGEDFDLLASGDQVSWWSGARPDQRRVIAGLHTPTLPLPSIAAALQAAELLGIDGGLWPCVGDVKLLGRYQQLTLNGRQLLLDVAHNPQAAQLLAQRLGQSVVGGRRYALFGVMADKDIAGIVKPLIDSFQGWSVATIAGVERAAASAQLAAELRSHGGADIKAFESVEAALDQTLARMRPEDQLVVFGSFYTVAAVLHRAGL